jgi:hypothetical protein
MKKNVIITLLLVVFSVSTVSAQGFLKKAGDALTFITCSLSITHPRSNHLYFPDKTC